MKKRWGHTVTKHSTIISGRKTSISLEDGFWNELRHIAQSRSMTLSQLIGMIDAERPVTRNLSSSIRVFVLQHYMGQVGAHTKLQKADNLALILQRDDVSHPDQPAPYGMQSRPA